MQTTPPQFVQRIHDTLYDIKPDIKPAILQSISWILTLQVFLISVIWYITVSHSVVLSPSDILSHLPQTFPIRVTAEIYEHWIRAKFPELPSVRKLTVWLRSAVLSVLPDPGEEPAGPSAASSGAGSNPLPTLNVDFDAIRARGI